MSFSELFGGNAIYPSDPTFLSRTLTADLPFQWPLEQNMGGVEVLASEIELTPNAAGHSVLLPDATQGSTGYTTTFFNAGADSFTIKDSVGGTLGVVASGEAWTVWLRDNSTVAGLWRVFQMGAGTSAANAADLAGAGLIAISTTLNAEMEIVNKSVNYAIVDGDRAVGLRWTGGVGTFTLPDPATVGAGWLVPIKNSGSGLLTINPHGGETIDDASSLQLILEDSAWLVTDGVDWFTFGFGQSTNSVFDFLSMSVAGTGDLVLAGSQLNRISYEFTGVLTGNRNIIVPATVQQYWVDNETTGAFTLTVKAAGGDPGVTVPQGTRIILYCNGTNVVNAETNTASLPAVVQGDLLYGTAPGILSALAKNASASRYLSNTGGSNNPAWAQINLANGVTGVLPAANGGSTFSAATVFKMLDQSLSDAVSTLITWDLETLDVGGWHDNAVNNTRLTVPAGVNYARFTAVVTVGDIAAANTPYFILAVIQANGSQVFPGIAHLNVPNLTGLGVPNAVMTMNLDTGWLAVTPGDYFEVSCSINGSGAGGIVEGSPQCNFTAEGHA